MPVPARRIVPETFIAAFVAAAAALMATGYLLDAVGLAIHPAVLAVAALAAAVIALVALRERAAAPAASLPIVACLVAAASGYFLWLAWPSLLPVTIGPDIVHHLQLIHVIHRTHHLANDPALGPYLLEMMNYTPGSHIAAAAVADWARLDPLRVLFPLTALFVAVKVGIVYVRALRLLAERPGAAVGALAAPVLLMIPAPYVLGSFFEFFYFAQVLSETFVVAMVMAALGWTRTGAHRYLWLAAACGIGVFLSWPVWILPGGAAVLAAIACDGAPMRNRVLSAVIVVVPVGLIGLLRASTHAAGASIIGSSGAVTKPSAETLGVAFVVLGVAGAILAFRPVPACPGAGARESRGGRPVRRHHSPGAGARCLRRPRQRAQLLHAVQFKMVYLIVLPCAVLGALALATASDAVASRLPRIRIPRLAGARPGQAPRLVGARSGQAAISAIPLLIAALLASGRMPVKRPRSPISESALAAGLWARDTLPAGCIDYFSRHWLTGYWLHLDVLGNPRLSDRMRAETFEFPDTVGKWIQGKGLPYGIVEDFAEIPRDARVDMITVREFGRSAIVKNTRPAPAPGFRPRICPVP